MQKYSFKQNKLATADLFNPTYVKCFADPIARGRALARAKNDADYRKSLFGEVFPKSIATLKGGTSLPILDFNNEAAWTAETIRFYSAELNLILQKVERFDRLLFQCDYHACDEILKQVTRDWGYSIWALKSELSLRLLRDGPDSAREYAERALGEAKTNTVRFLCRHLGIRLDPSTSPARFINIIARAVTDAKKVDQRNPLIPYSEYTLLFYTERPISNFSSILHVENDSALLDRYLTFRRITTLIYAMRQDAGLLRATKNALSIIGGRIHDQILNLVTACVHRRAITPTFAYPEKCVRMLDLYTSGKYADSVRLAYELLQEAPDEFPPYEIIAKAGLELGDSIASNAIPQFAAKVIPALQSLVAADANSRANHEWLWRMILMLDQTPWAAQAFTFLQYEFHHFGQDLPKHYQLYGALNSRQQPNPRLLRSLHDAGEHGIVVATEAIFAQCLTYKLHKLVTTTPNLESLEKNLSYLQLEPARQLRTQAEFLYENKEYEAALVKFELLDESMATRRHYSALVFRMRCLIHLSRVHEALEVAANALIQQPTCWSKLPLRELIDAGLKSRHPKVTATLNLATVVGAYSVNIGHNYEEFQVDICEDYLEANSVQDPCELSAPDSEIENAKFEFFLARGCALSVLDSIDGAEGSFGVQAWRIRVCQRVLEITKVETLRMEMEAEIKELTRIISTSKRLTVLQQSLIYVDVDNLRKSLSVTLHPQYIRFTSLISDATVNITFDILKCAIAENPKSNNTNHLIFGQNLTGIELLDILKAMILEVRDAFAMDQKYGLNTSLSMEIRHGSLEGYIRRNFENLHLVTRKDSKTNTYSVPRYWLERLAPTPSNTISSFQSRMEIYSRALDDYIQHVNNERIQIATETLLKPNAFFDFRVDASLLARLLSNARKETPLETFIDSVIDEMWLMADQGLTAAREYFEKNAYSQISTLTEGLERDLSSILGSSLHPELVDNLTNARVSLHDRLHRLAAWFTRSAVLEMAGYSLDDTVRLAKDMLENVHHGMILNLDIQSTASVKVRPRAVRPLYNIFYNLFDNCRKYGQQVGNSNSVKYSASIVGDQLKLIIANQVGEFIDQDKVREHLDEVHELARTALLLSRGITRVGGEGRSGFLKIAKLLVYDLGADYEMKLTLDKGIFSVTIILDIKYIQ